MDTIIDTNICFSCGIIGKYSDLAFTYVGHLAEILQDGILAIMAATVPVWFVISLILILLKKKQIAGLGEDALYIIIAFSLLSVNGAYIVSSLYILLLNLIGSTASLTFIGSSEIQTYTTVSYQNSGMIDLVYTVEGAVRKVFTLALNMMSVPTKIFGFWKVEILTPMGIVMGILLIIPYFYVLVTFFSKVVIAVFRVMMLSIFAPLVAYCWAFGWGRGMAIKAAKTAFAAIMIMLSCTAAVGMLVYGVNEVNTTAIKVDDISVAFWDYLFIVALGWLGTAFMVEANGIANSLTDAVLTNAGTGVIAAGATASAAVAAKHGFNPLTSAKNLKGKAGEKFGAESAAIGAAAKGVGGAAGAVGAAAVQGIKTVQDKITRLRELGQ